MVVRRRFLALILAIFFLTGYGFSALAKGVEGKNEAVKETKRVALTFDDGPHPHDTDRILTLLSLYGIKATFFVIGENAERYPEPLLRAVAEGHEIGNHTYSHPKLKDQSRESFLCELTRAEEVIRSLTGVTTTLFRPPEGYRQGVVSTVSRERGYEMVLWSVDTLDWTGASADSIESAITGGIKDGSIILCHDYISPKGHTYEALEKLIPRLIDEGYEFVTVSELLNR